MTVDLTLKHGVKNMMQLGFMPLTVDVNTNKLTTVVIMMTRYY